LNIQVSFVKYLGKEVGVEYQATVISKVLGLTTASPTTAGGNTAASGRAMLDKALIRLLIATFDVRDKQMSAFIGQSCVVIRDTLLPSCSDPNNATDLFTLLLRLIHRMLSMHWKTYFATTVVENEPGTASPCSTTAMRPVNPMLASMGKRVTRIVNGERLEELRFLLQLTIDCFKADGIPPAVVGLDIQVLRDVNKLTKLFAVQEVSQMIKGSFFSTLMECLLKGTQPVLTDDISELLFEIANSDIDDFFQSFLPQLVGSLSFREEIKIELLQAWPNDRDSASFSLCCQDFLSEYRYATSRASMT
jgi:hypothetical protein